ncbi:MAG: phosphatidate cytidylyltransferase [Ignavibacteriales bacterium]|nr:phosphatidate cytidylyltransferase [Ignavibacteriales bacterium]
MNLTDRFERLPTRVAVAVVAIPLIALSVFEGGYWFFAFVALISTISLYEYYGLTKHKGAFPLTGLGLMAGLSVNAGFIYERIQVDVYSWFIERGIHLKMFSQLQFILVVLIVFLLVILSVELFRTKGSALLNVGSTVTGVLIISLCFGFLIGLRELFSYGFPVHRFFGSAFSDGSEAATIVHRWGGWTVLALFVSVWVCDTAAYFVGSMIGRHKLYERVSPSKTWEGAVTGFVCAVGVIIAAQQTVLPYLRLVDGIALGVLVGVFGQIGDLVESKFKRDAGLKDSSALIPGHGGVYDRFDSVVFLSPFVYLYIDFIVLS